MKQSQLGWSLFVEQLKWAAWFFGIMIILTIGITASTQWGFLDNLDVSNTTSNVFLLIIGLLYSYGFLDYYFKLGISRKKFFKASLFASVLLSVILAFAMSLMIGLFETLVPALGFTVPWSDLLSSGGVLSFIKSIADYSVSHFFYLLIGWFMGLGFYRFRWKIGLLFILLSFPFFGVSALLQDQDDIAHTINFFTSNSLIISMGPYVIFFIMIVILIICNYRLTKDAPIRL
ncbi:hypothetical protein J18TS1_18030 [Oceanobacillus oncorhynchi subsp. incaldanensis]|uniref:ABC-2 family transporter protein n=2 Tax=Oceanobacillus TaxID=182709 RepID=A0A0A1MRP7_9BACI|nr:hypothetical protein [Oceanobacillus oncorhynchi]MDM8100346.1 hypothetical protein [Oceanobacillus oncorhynchi]UUI40841.1 hypothetical protein NP440_04420 [Oceanobacillus oncorhynchi]GIO18703.1 hypothetical protein J18TS1_18030 [Oceanobacillus oncorhynchi subsp. incaldanensis]CEI82277.1 hypothetical protein BN997_02137 [Oceanobacillus oncorhynchi]